MLKQLSINFPLGRWLWTMDYGLWTTDYALWTIDLGRCEVDISYRIELEKENFKFSASHFTIFGAGRAERLHGHNYYVYCEIELASVDPNLGLAFDFNLVKPMIREATEALDEYVLVPQKSSYLKIETDSSQVKVRFGSKQYSFPIEDTQLLPVVNITSEELARFIAEDLHARLKQHPEALGRIRTFSIGVQESRGQTVFFQIEPAKP